MKVLATEVNISDAKTLRDFGDKLRDKLESGIIFLGGKAGEKAFLLCMVTKDLAGKYSRRQHHQGTRPACRRQRRRPSRHGPGRRHPAGKSGQDFSGLGKVADKVVLIWSLHIVIPGLTRDLYVIGNPVHLQFSRTLSGLSNFAGEFCQCAFLSFPT